jgi:ferredoxin-thioredoxin reductase catalytic subunit
MDKEIEELKKNLVAFAKEFKYEVTSDADKIIKALINRKKKFGEHYCPCRPVYTDNSHESIEYNKKIICPCAFVHDDILKRGKCHCNLFKATPLGGGS